jgi:hypothetical protein
MTAIQKALNDNKPYGRNWEDFLLPDQMEFLYKAFEQFAAPPPDSEGDMADVEAVIFFELKNKKYVTKSGFEITTDMLMKAEHFISDDVCYIKVPLATLPTREPEAKKIDDFISELMESDPIRFVKYCLIIIGRDILDSGAVSLKLSVESDLREGRRFAVNVTGKIKELK